MRIHRVLPLVTCIVGLASCRDATNPQLPVAPTLSATSTTGSFAYVADHDAHSVQVIDVSTNAVIATVPVGAFPFHIAFTPDGEYAYVTNQGSNDVSVIETDGNTVVATVPVGVGPRGVAASPGGEYVFVAQQTGGTVTVIETATNTVADSVDVNTLGTPFPGPRPFGMAFTPDGASAYVGTEIGSVVVIDVATLTVTETITGFPSVPSVGLFDLAMAPDGAHVYVTNHGASSVSVIETTTNTIVASVPVGTFPQWISLTPDGSAAYVADFLGDEVHVIETATNTVVVTVSVGSHPQGIALTPDGAAAYVSVRDANQVSVIETATNTIVTSVPMASRPIGLSILAGQTAEDLLESILDDVLANADLNGGQANALASKLNNAIAKIEPGKEATAINMLQAFINQVEAFAQSGTITQAEADALIAAAQEVIDLLSE